MKRHKLLQKILQSQKNVRFADFVNLVEGFGFVHARTNGSHQIFNSPKVKELVNLQNVNGEVKPYQIKQFLSVVEKYNLILEE